MKTTNIKKLILGLAIAVFLSSATAYAGTCAYGYEKPMHGNKEERFQKLTEELGLTPEQKELIEKQRTGFRSRNKGLRKKFRTKKKALKNELEKANVDKSSVDSIIGDLKELTGEKLQNRVDHVLSMKEILTPEQYDKLKEKMHEKRKHYKRKRRHND